jgi:hypothetical protein
MRRLLLVPILALAGVGALAIPAQAKGPVESASGRIVITGPGLKGPIELKGTVRGFAEPGDGFMPMEAGTDGDFTAFLLGSGLLSAQEAQESSGWYTLPPDNLRAIGPAYQLRVELTGEGWSESIVRRLYPFAPERPLVFTPAESVTSSRVRMLRQGQGLWWSATPALLEILRPLGLPLGAPPELAGPAPVEVPALHAQGWVVVWASLAFLGLLVAGVLAGRRKVRLA